MRGEAHQATVDALISHIRTSRLRPGLVMIDIAYEVSLPTALQRKQIADAVKETIASSGVGIEAHALVTSSTVARAALTAINWFVAPEFPERVFGDVPSALSWCRERSPRVDPEALLGEVRRAVPGFDGLRW